MHGVRQPGVLFSLLLVTLFTNARRTDSQATVDLQNAKSYGLSVSVDEVLLTFHAADTHGLPINDLKLEELSLVDNGKPPRKILSFQSVRDLPLRAGILIDTSESMQQDLAGNQAISIKYLQRLVRQPTDLAFVMKFGPVAEIAQAWTGDSNALAAGIRRFTATRTSHLHGTALFNAVYQACLNQFGHIDRAGSGNFILLFSDGEDNAGNTSLKNVIDQCQHTNTAIYAFRTDTKVSFGSAGPKILADLASQSGGRVFNANESDAEIDSDLRMIEANLRNQYRLIYRPAELAHDGSFHRISLRAPERVDNIVIRSGYYAPFH